MPLHHDNQLADPDAALAMLTAAHHGLDAGASAALNARLVLILMNEVADLATLQDAIATARHGLSPAAAPVASQ
ncbi:MAG: DUF2783 domain-containing protein [Hyphomicrobiaceae bacterium]